METLDLVVSTFPVPMPAVVLSVVDDVNLIDSDGVRDRVNLSAGS